MTVTNRVVIVTGGAMGNGKGIAEVLASQGAKVAIFDKSDILPDTVEELRGKGLGKRLMDKAKEVAKKQKRRAIILETQSCNTNAIGFYLHQGFELIGFDTCCYTNNDIGRREVRINLGFFFNREGRRR